MQKLNSGRGAFSAGLAVALLAGCGGSPTETPGALPRSAVSQLTKGNTSYLYTSDNQYGVGIVYIFSYPDPSREAVRAITGIGYVYGPCADPTGKVWVPADDRHGATVFEFNHGETKPIARIKIPNGDGVGECAVDPTTGNLAVLGTNAVDVFKGAVQGKPIRYAIPNVTVIASTYDKRGNLFVDGMEGSSAPFLLYELAKGHDEFARLTLDKPEGFPGGIVWDGQHVAVATGGNGHEAVIYRFKVVGNMGKVVQVVRPNGLQVGAWFAVGDGDIVGTSGNSSSGESVVRVWPYPAGGGWIWRLDGTVETQGLAISSAR
jgi:hypothetical protein